MASIVEKAKENPLQAVTVGIAVIGVVFSIFNFYLLANIAPLERRVEAIEKRNEKVDPLVDEFIGIKETVRQIQMDVSEVKEDTKELLRRHLI
jgi:uncharacterized protein YoxC